MKTIAVRISAASPESEEWVPVALLSFPACDDSDADLLDDAAPQLVSLPSGEVIDISLVYSENPLRTRLFVFQDDQELSLIPSPGHAHAVTVTLFNTVLKLSLQVRDEKMATG